MKMVPESTRVHTTDPELLERVRDCATARRGLVS